MKKTISIVLIIIWMAVIFGFSSMPGDESNAKSKLTIKEAINTIIVHGKNEKAEENMSESIIESVDKNQTGESEKAPSTTQTQQNQTNQKEQKEEQLIEKLNKPLRKCMHASVYFVLSILIYNCLKTFKVSDWKTLIIPIIISFLYACTDEFHQLFVEGRTSQFTDVLIDTTGAIIGILVISLIKRIITKINQQKRTKKIQKTIAQ